jgi:hypothetical protein
MTTTTGNESLFWQHVEDGDIDGASQHLPTASERLRACADKYLEDAVESGEVSSSRLLIGERLGVFAGYTTVETASGVKIMKTSDGSFNVTAEYEESGPDDPVGSYQDLTVEIELPSDGSAVVIEDRQKVVDHTHTGDGGSRTLSKRGGERVMGEVAKMIWQVYE